MQSGYAVHAFTDPVTALDHFRENAPVYSLILTDIKMPGMSGAELAKRAKKTRPGMPFHTADVCCRNQKAFDRSLGRC